MHLNTKKDCICRRYACTDRSGDCAWQCDRNEYPFFTGGGVLLCRDCDSGIWIEKRGRLFTGWNFAGNPSVSNKLYVVSYAFMGFYILIIETIWHFFWKSFRMDQKP